MDTMLQTCATVRGPLRRPYDVEAIRQQFPVLHQPARGRALVYLDNAATTQKPRAVIDRLQCYYLCENANIHRGVYALSQRATDCFENARRRIAHYINAPDPRQVILTRGTTESINLVASSLGRLILRPGDEILITWMEHHSNIVPWQLICQQTGAVLRVAPINDRGELPLEEFGRLLSDRTRIVSLAHLSNSLGTINPVRQIAAMAHQRGAVVVVDGAQWVAHRKTDVQDLDVDFYAFSGHKLYGPTGVGVLYGRAELLERMPPYQGGGDMISSVTFEKTTYNELPHKFEAGTPNIAGAIGLGTAVDWIEEIGLDAIAAHEEELYDHATQVLGAVPGLRLIGTAAQRASVLSFVLEHIHPHDIGTVLDSEGLAIRTGHHCCQPVMERFGVPATARVSLACYNTTAEIDALGAALGNVIRMFA